MIEIVVAGLGKEKIQALARESGGDQVNVAIKSDIEAAMAVKSGKADYYIGACFSGAGGALAVATGILGSSKVIRLSGTGVPPKRETIEQAVAQGKLGFGLATDHIDFVIPILITGLLDKHKVAR